jgi:hypothetical protein
MNHLVPYHEGIIWSEEYLLMCFFRVIVYEYVYAYIYLLLIKVFLYSIQNMQYQVIVLRDIETSRNFFSSTQHPDWVLSPHSLLYNRY